MEENKNNHEIMFHNVNYYGFDEIKVSFAPKDDQYILMSEKRYKSILNQINGLSLRLQVLENKLQEILPTLN